MFSNILVPLDGSTLAERVIPHAEQFARIFGAHINLLQVLDPASFHENSEAIEPLRWQIRKAEAEMYMRGVSARIREHLGEYGEDKKDRVAYTVLEGKTAENIVDFAHVEGIDLLVISTHGSGGLSRWSMSSVTQKVINQIFLHVLLVRAQGPSGLDSNVHYRRILLPVDCSRRAESSLSAGIALTREVESLGSDEPQIFIAGPSSEQPKLVLAAVVKPPEIPIPKPYPVEVNLLAEQVKQVSRHAVTDYLDQMRERLPVACETRVVDSESTPAAIQQLAAQDDIDLVVMSAHGYSGQLTPYGTVTRSYLENGTKPVLVIQDVPLRQAQQGRAEISAIDSGRRQAWLTA